MDSGLDVPNLGTCSYAYNVALRSVEALTEPATSRKCFEESFDVIKAEVLQVMHKRQKDCVSPLAEAAGYVELSTIYGDDNSHTPSNGAYSLQKFSIMYYRRKGLCATEAAEKAAECISEATQLRSLCGPFARTASQSALSRKGALTFWEVNKNFAPALAPIAVKLACAWSGQSEVERDNKKIAAVLTPQRIARLGQEKVEKIRIVQSTNFMEHNVQRQDFTLPYIAFVHNDICAHKIRRLSSPTLEEHADDEMRDVEKVVCTEQVETRTEDESVDEWGGLVEEYDISNEAIQEAERKLYEEAEYDEEIDVADEAPVSCANARVPEIITLSDENE